MEDKQIVELYLRRDEQAIDQTAKKYGSYCFSIANNILDNYEDTEETVSDTYVSCWRAIPPHRPGNLGTFLGKITRRLAIKRWRANHTLKRGGGEMPLVLEELAGCIPAENDPERDMEMLELSRALNRFVGQLPKTERTVFVCRYWYLDSIEMIGKRYGFSQSKVKSMLSRTRKKLQTYLEKEGITL